MTDERLQATTEGVTGFTSYKRAVIECLERHYEGSLGTVAGLIWEYHEQERPICTCGNGGSAATAMHFAADLGSLGFPVMDLLSPCKVTQAGNDWGYGEAFAGQVCDSPLVLAFSCSGTSRNIERLCYTDAFVVLFTSEMNEKVVPANVIIRARTDDYEIAEDVHSMMCHALKKMLEYRLESES